MESDVNILLQEKAALQRVARQTTKWWKTDFQVFIPAVTMKYTDAYSAHSMLYDFFVSLSFMLRKKKPATTKPLQEIKESSTSLQ